MLDFDIDKSALASLSFLFLCLSALEVKRVGTVASILVSHFVLRLIHKEIISLLLLRTTLRGGGVFLPGTSTILGELTAPTRSSRLDSLVIFKIGIGRCSLVLHLEGKDQ